MSATQAQSRPHSGAINGTAIGALVLYLALWGSSVFYLYSKGGEEWMETVIIAAIFGLALPAVAWALTLGAKAPAIDVRRPAIETGAVLVYLALYTVLFLVFGLNWAHAVLPEGQGQDMLIMGMKLAVHVVLPVLLLIALRARLAPMFQVRANLQFWLTLVVMGAIILALLCFISPSLQNIEATHTPLTTLLWIGPLSYVWITIEAGLCEEVLYRAVLQTRLTAFFNSPWAGVIATSILFALAHAPGLYLRGGAETHGAAADPIQVAAYTIAMLSPISLLFGLLYARTKSLLLVILLHGMVDVLPNMSEFIRTWL
ncbi:lysostaphin resistance A-like protein [Terricaulis sp.]|uniref:lysostaphin resistance A-like protein n=1 Tax=Terricaulis sp. TaxID=2768686 RepID=UPI003783A9D4